LLEGFLDFVFEDLPVEGMTKTTVQGNWRDFIEYIEVNCWLISPGILAGMEGFFFPGRILFHAELR
jgi:hypothetical protein